MPEFPADVVWGAATAAYQIEGAAGKDGHGESNGDRFCATPGKVRNGDFIAAQRQEPAWRASA